VTEAAEHILHRHTRAHDLWSSQFIYKVCNCTSYNLVEEAEEEKKKEEKKEKENLVRKPYFARVYKPVSVDIAT